MNSKIKHIREWEKIAQQSNWSVSKMARYCGVSTDTLRRHMKAIFGKGPRQWLAEKRQRQAIELLSDGSTIKETATILAYRQQSNFTRKFKKHWGHCPSEYTNSIGK